MNDISNVPEWSIPLYSALKMEDAANVLKFYKEREEEYVLFVNDKWVYIISQSDISEVMNG